MNIKEIIDSIKDSGLHTTLKGPLPFSGALAPAKKVKPLPEIQPLLLQIREIILYPNPASTSITVQLPEAVEDDSDIPIFDMMGILKLSSGIPAFENSEDINIESLPQGVYIVSIVRNGVLQKSISLLVIRN